MRKNIAQRFGALAACLTLGALAPESLDADQPTVGPELASDAIDAFGPPAPTTTHATEPDDAEPAPEPANEQPPAPEAAPAPEATPATVQDARPAAQPDAADDAVAAAEASPSAVPPGVESLPLGAPAQLEGVGAESQGMGLTFADNWVGRTVLALALVIGLAVLLRGLLRRAASTGGGLAGQLTAGGRAPSGLLSVLGRYPVARGQTLVLLKVDRRVLLLCQTAAGFRPLSEITDPEEVASILMTARDEEGTSMAARFQTVMRDMERDPRIAGVEEADDAWGPTSPRALAGRRSSFDAADDADPVASLRRRLANLSEQTG